MQKTFPTLTSLKSGMQTNEIKFLDNDPTLPYVLRDEQFYYFAQNLIVYRDVKNIPVFNPHFSLVLTSSRDLQEAK